MYALMANKAIVLLKGVEIAWSSRRIASDFNEAKSIAVVIWNIAMVGHTYIYDM